MKKMILTTAALLGAVLLSAQQMPPIPVDEAVRIGQLENGLTYYIRHNEEPKGQANFYIAQKVGSILENDDQRGLAHFLEHMCFNGTEHFPGGSLITYLESIGVKFGAELNAYTSIDETVYNIDKVPVANVPSSIDSCLFILRDWAGGLLLTDEEIDKERGVIHEEWRSRSNAQQRAFESVLPRIFPGNKYGERLPIGTMEVVDNFPYQVLRDYYHTWYRPDQQGIIVVGDIDVDLIEAKIVEIFSSLPAAAADAPERYYVQIEDNPETIVASYEDKELPYAMSYIFAKHPNVPNEAKYTLDYMLYDYVISIVDIMAQARVLEMTQKSDPDFVDASFGDGSDFFIAKTCGSYQAYVMYDENQMLRALTSIYREMLRVVRHGFTASEYERARTEYLSQLESAYNQKDKRKSSSFCRDYVRHFIDNEPIPGIENEFALMSQLAPNIPVEMVNQVCATFKGEGNLVVVNMLPAKEGVTYPSEDEIAAALAAVEAEEIAPYEDTCSDEPLISKIRKPGKVKKTDEAAFGFKKYSLSNGATVYFKQTDFNKDEVLFNAFSWGGTSLYDQTDVTVKVVGELTDIAGVGKFSLVDLNKALAGKKLSLTPVISTYDERLSGKSTPKDLETLFQLNYLYFTEPRYDEEAFASYKVRTASTLLNQEAQPTKAFQDSLIHNVYLCPEKVLGITYADVDKIDYRKAYEIIKQRFANAADFTFVIVGNVDEQTLVPLLNKYVASLPAKGKKETFTACDFNFRKGVNESIFKKEMETPFALNFMAYSAPCEYTLRNSLLAEMAGSALGVELYEEIREKEGGTYGINSFIEIKPYEEESALLEIVYQCAPERAEYLNSRVNEIVSEYAKNGPKTENVEKARLNMAKSFEEDVTENSYWSGNMQSLLKNKVDMHTDYLEILNSITNEEIREFTENILKSGNVHTVIMLGTEKQ
ncbi:MAG: M16 family metallopeptidase [Candidatus Cryptobacteroides sp.]